MATISKDIIRVVLQQHGSSPKFLEYPEAASQTFVKGELVFGNAAGFVAEIASDTPATILGVAAEDASNDSNNGDSQAGVYWADPSNVFEGNMLETGAADHVLAATDMLQTMGIQRVTADGKVYLDASVTGANSRVFVHKVAPGSAVGDTNARVLFTFLPNFVAYLGTS